MQTYQLDSKATLGSLNNPHPNSAASGPAFAGQYYFKSTYTGDGKTWNEDNISQYTKEGKRLGKTVGSTGPGKNYVLPAEKFLNPQLVPLPPKKELDKMTDAERTAAYKATYASAGLVMLAAAASMINYKTGGSAEIKATRPRTAAELKAATKGMSPDKAIAFLTNPANLTVEEITPAVEPGDVVLADVVKKGGNISVSPGEVAGIVARAGELIRDGFRVNNVES